jgi:hypothetical protein
MVNIVFNFSEETPFPVPQGGMVYFDWGCLKSKFINLPDL